MSNHSPAQHLVHGLDTIIPAHADLVIVSSESNNLLNKLIDR